MCGRELPRAIDIYASIRIPYPVLDTYTIRAGTVEQNSALANQALLTSLSGLFAIKSIQPSKKIVNYREIESRQFNQRNAIVQSTGTLYLPETDVVTVT